MVDPNSRTVIIIGVILIIGVIIIITLILLFRNNDSTNNGDQTNCALLPFPLNIKGNVQGISSIKLTWNVVSGATRYRVFIGTVPGFVTANALTTELSDSNEIVISSLVSGRDYYIRIETLNQCNLAGSLSPELKIVLGFPSEFIIANRNNNGLVFGTNDGSTALIRLETDCREDDEFCYWIFNPNDRTVRPKNDITRCMVSKDDNPNPDFIGLDLCINIPQAEKQWEYDEDLGSICHPVPSGGFSCIKTPSIAPGQEMIINSYDGTTSMQWDILGI